MQYTITRFMTCSTQKVTHKNQECLYTQQKKNKQNKNFVHPKHELHEK